MHEEVASMCASGRSARRHGVPGAGIGLAAFPVTRAAAARPAFLPPAGDAVRLRQSSPALEHLLPAASAIADERDFIVIGSQAVLGQFPDAPEALLVSVEPYPRRAAVCGRPRASPAGQPSRVAAGRAQPTLT
jgi:hypothetical protein